MESINTNLADYTLDELFRLLDIKIESSTDMDSLTSQIQKKTDAYINQFTKMNKPLIATFFTKIQSYLIAGPPTNTNTSANNVISYGNNYNYSNKSTNIQSSDMFNANNGAGNPIHRKTVTKLLNIDTRFRDNYLTTTSTNCIITLPYEINNVIEMTLSDLELPTTYYPFSTANNNNYMWIKSYISVTNAYFYNYLFIPDGNYYFDDLIQFLNSTDGLGAFTFTPLVISFDLNYNNLGSVGTGTGKITIFINGVTDIDYIELNFSAPPIPGLTKSKIITDPLLYSKYYDTYNIPLNQKLGWMLGFRNKLYNTNKLSYTSDSVMDIVGPKYLFLLIDDGNNNTNINFISAFVNAPLPGTIMSRISLKGAAFNIQAQNDFSVYSEPRYYYGPVNINNFKINLIDEFNRIVDLNLNDFSFTLKLTVVYSAT